MIYDTDIKFWTPYIWGSLIINPPCALCAHSHLYRLAFSLSYHFIINFATLNLFDLRNNELWLNIVNWYEGLGSGFRGRKIIWLVSGTRLTFNIFVPLDLRCLDWRSFSLTWLLLLLIFCITFMTGIEYINLRVYCFSRLLYACFSMNLPLSNLSLKVPLTVVWSSKLCLHGWVGGWILQQIVLDIGWLAGFCNNKHNLTLA